MPVKAIAKRRTSFVQTLLEGTTIEIDEKGEPVLPTSLAACADLLYQTRANRLTLSREAERFGKLEAALEAYIIDNLPKSQASGIAGQLARAQIVKKPKLTVEDWPSLYLYIRKHSAFELLQRRLNESAAKEHAENGQPVPGVGTFVVLDVSCTAL